MYFYLKLIRYVIETLCIHTHARIITKRFLYNNGIANTDSAPDITTLERDTVF